MKIYGVGVNKVNNIYNENKKNIEKRKETLDRDSIEISSIGKSLSECSIDKNYIVSDEKVESIKKEIENGTYHKDTNLVAQKILDHINGRGI